MSTLTPTAALRRRERLVSRMWKAAERQVAEIEGRLQPRGGPADPAALERDAKTLAVLARTLRELDAFSAETQERSHAGHADTTAEPPPLDLDSFRQELESRLAAVRDARRSPRAD
jgi:hypothetical protein